MTPAHVFEISNAPDCSIITFFGALDAAAMQRIKPTLQESLSPTARNVIVDLRKVNFLDSHGIGLFVSLVKKLNAGKGRLYVAGAEGQPASVLKMVGLDEKFVTYCKDADEARALVSSGAPLAPP